MIHTVIFDIGNVLLTYQPKRYIEKWFDEPKLRDALYPATFGSEEWARLDEGTISFDEAVSNMQRRIPGLENEVFMIMKSWPDEMTLLEDSVRLLRDLKSNGYRTLYLSNFHEYARDYLRTLYNFWDELEGGIFSCDVKLLKPDPEIYRALLERCGINARECVFFDDMQQNVSAASALGIHGHIFTGVREAKAFLSEVGVSLS